jgi:hypothetical protein
VQKSVQEITGKYAAQGITVDYTLFGHLHASAIGDYHARNASLAWRHGRGESGCINQGGARMDDTPPRYQLEAR